MTMCVRFMALVVSLASVAESASAQVVQGTLDAAVSVGCSVAGWARDPQNASPIQVRIYANGDSNSGVLVATILADLLRSDLPFADQNHGFDYAFTDAQI